MVLHKISDFDPDYRDTVQGNDVKGMGVYTQDSEEKIGTVSDVLVDDYGEFRYLVVDLGFWIFGKKVLLPVGRSRIDFNANRVYAIGLGREQAENLPEFSDRMTVDYDYEERVRGVYRDRAATYDRNTYAYAQDADLYDTTAHPDQTIRLYAERLVANKQRRKAGEVAIGKRVETETATVEIPLEKERVVIERISPTDVGTVVTPDATAFREGEVARMEIYEETPEIHKEAVLREEVTVRKVVDRDTVEAQDTVRHEELDIDAQGLPVQDMRDRQ
jgi:uncharacterized protein (TIGR02271 family)